MRDIGFNGREPETEIESKINTAGRQHLDTVTIVRTALMHVKDPEIPTLSLEELGMVYDIEVYGNHGERVQVRLIPTFAGCPAVEFLRQLVSQQIEKIDGIEQVDVAFVMDVPWTTERITKEGRRKLEAFGIAPPPHTFSPKHRPTCTYCGANDTDIVSLFGPTACRSVYYCKHCKQPFEGMKFV